MINYLAIDIGGTYTRLGFFDKENLVDTIVMDTPRQPQDLLKILEKEIRSKAFLEAIAVGAPGYWDHKCILKQSINLPEYIDYPLWSLLSERIKLPIFLKSDVELATIGEAIYGFKNKYNNFLYINMGTGLGAGLYKDGEIFNTNYSPTLRLEFLVNPDSQEEDQSRVNLLATTLINLTCILAPQIIVFGGGKVANNWDSLIVPATVKAAAYLNNVMPYQIAFDRSKLEYPSLYGGLELIKQQTNIPQTT